jgi:hypothetical protein
MVSARALRQTRLGVAVWRRVLELMTGGRDRAPELPAGGGQCAARSCCISASNAKIPTGIERCRRPIMSQLTSMLRYQSVSHAGRQAVGVRDGQHKQRDGVLDGWHGAHVGMVAPARADLGRGGGAAACTSQGRGGGRAPTQVTPPVGAAASDAQSTPEPLSRRSRRGAGRRAQEQALTRMVERDGDGSSWSARDRA